MTRYEYRTVPAPRAGLKAKGVKTPEARFAHGLEVRINEMAAEGWEYLRADTLPSDERAGLTQSVTVWRTVLVFRRAVADEVGARPLLTAAPEAAPDPARAPVSPAPPVWSDPAPSDASPRPAPPAVPPPVKAAPAAPLEEEDAPRPEPTDALGRMLKDRAATLVPRNDSRD